MQADARSWCDPRWVRNLVVFPAGCFSPQNESLWQGFALNPSFIPVGILISSAHPCELEGVSPQIQIWCDHPPKGVPPRTPRHPLFGITGITVYHVVYLYSASERQLAHRSCLNPKLLLRFQKTYKAKTKVRSRV